MRSLEERFWSKVVKGDGCWTWIGARVHGYGFFFVEKLNGKIINEYAHRFSYKWLVGGIPEGLTIDHLCRNRSCVNPAHMEVVTQGENNKRGHMQTHCMRGHALTADNRYSHGECQLCSKLRYMTKKRKKELLDEHQCG